MFNLGAAVVEIKAKLQPLREGLQQARRETDSTTRGMSDNFDRTGTSIAGMRTKLLGATAAFAGLITAARGLAAAGDQMRLLQGRFVALTGSAERGREIFQNMIQTAKDANAEITTSAAAFTRFTLAAEALQKTDEQVRQFTANLLQMGRIAGSSQGELAAGALQLAQGLSSGAVRGDELNSILENLPTVAQAIAEELGVGTGELRQMGEDGMILSEVVFQAVLNKTDEIEQQLKELPPTVTAVASELAITWTQFTAEIDNSIGASEALVATLQGAIRLLDQVRAIPAQVRANANMIDQFRLRRAAGGGIGPFASEEQIAAGRDAAARRPVTLTPDESQRSPTIDEEMGLTTGPGRTLQAAIDSLNRVDPTAPTVAGKPQERPVDFIPFVDGSYAARTTRRRGGGGGRSISGASTRRATDGIEQLLTRLEERVDRLGQEAQLAGLSGRERAAMSAAFERERIERELVLRAQRDGIQLTPEQIALTQNLAAATEELTLEAFDQAESLRDVADAAREAEREQERLAKAVGDVANRFTSAIQRADSFTDALKNIGLELLDIAAQAAVGQGPAGGLLNDLLGVAGGGLIGLIGGSSLAPTTSPIPVPAPRPVAGFAQGGVPPMNRFVNVAEGGMPEVAVFGEAARIMPLNKLIPQRQGGGEKMTTNNFRIIGLDEAQARTFVDLKLRESEKRSPAVIDDLSERGF